MYKTQIYIELSAGVRYWDDAIVNGVEDTDGTLIPLRKGDCWSPVIRLADGMVMDWTQGTTADVHFEVCDAGEYWLQDIDRKRVSKWTGFYVPGDFLCPSDNGYGDYIILKISANGLIEKWRTPEVRMVCSCDEDDQSGWAEISPDPKDGLIPDHIKYPVDTPFVPYNPFPIKDPKEAV